MAKKKTLVKLSKLPLDQLAVILGSTEYEAMKYLQICKDVIPVAFRFPNKEETKRKTIFRIVKALANSPCTHSVLSKRSHLSRSIVSRYLNKLIYIGAVKSEIDERCGMKIYYISSIPTELPVETLEDKQNAIWQLWIDSLPEYQISSYTDNKLNGSAVKVIIKDGVIKTVKDSNPKHKRYIMIENGKNSKMPEYESIDVLEEPNAAAQQRAVENFKKTHRSTRWKLLYK